MTYDINIMGPPTTVEALLRLDNTAIAGVQKLVQRTMVLMFTDVSDPVNLGLGTTLATDLKGGSADLEIIRNFFNIALALVKDTIRQQTPLDAPDDEQISGYDVAVSKPARDTVVATITVKTAAGTTVAVQVPLKHLAV